MPRVIVRAVAVVGDLLELCGKRFPITSSRYRSMTQDYLVPMERTWEVLGSPHYSLEEGITETLQWLDQQGAPRNKAERSKVVALREPQPLERLS